jgi:hypothetical protein
MAASETWLTIIAVRLAALVAAGLFARAAVADHAQQPITCAPDRAVIRSQPLPFARPIMDETLRDMLLHD